MARTDLENEVMDKLSKDLAEDIDRQILWGWLKETGWTFVKIIFQNNIHAIDVNEWVDANAKGKYLRAGGEYLFEDSKDATMFILRWSDASRRT